jgi:acetyl esterase/lipase
MSVHPQVLELRAKRVAAGAKPVARRTVDEARAEEARNLQPLTATFEPLRAPGPAGPLALHLYRPRRAQPAPLPALAWLFGGGWVLGSLVAAGPVCAALAEHAGCAVVAIDYRRAPEHPFPAAVDDCVAGARWLREEAAGLGLDPDRIAIGGASAGGTLAAVVALIDRGREPAFVLQVLVYPLTAYRSGTPSLASRGDPYFLDEAALEWAWSHYLPEGFDPGDPRISPLRAPDHRGLPPALVVLAGHDPLHDEGLLYAERLEQAGVSAEVVDFPGMVHGFFSLTGIVDAADEAQRRVAVALRRAFRLDGLQSETPAG